MKIRNLAIALPLMVAAIQPVSAAQDGKTLPGATCQPVNKDQVFAVNNQGALVNTSNSATLTVVCPLVRDVMSANAAGINSVTVHVVDNNNDVGDPNVSCRLDSRQITAGSVINSTSVISLTLNTNGSDTGVQQLSFGNLESQTNGYYFLRCTIPPIQVVGNENRQSGIMAYRWVENE